MGLGHPQRGDVRFLERSIPAVVTQDIQAAVLRVLPAVMHEVKHAPVAGKLRFRQLEDVQGSRFRIIRQIRRDAVGNEQVEFAIAGLLPLDSPNF